MEGRPHFGRPFYQDFFLFPSMKVHGLPARSIRSLEGGESVEIIDQTLLPFRFERRVLTSKEERSKE